MDSKNNNLSRFSPKMKMADAIAHHNSLLTVLPRLGIPLGFGEKTIEKLCNEFQVSQPLFMLISSVYIQDDYYPSNEELQQCEVSDIVQYLLSSHKDYIDNKLPHIEHHLDAFLDNVLEKYRIIIANFYSDFKKEIINHFKYEEEVVFPYLKQITLKVEKNSGKRYGKTTFTKQHDDIEDTLKDLTNLLLKYIPADVASTERIDMLLDMYSLASDIEKHALLEDRILIPYIKLLESKEND